VATASASDLAVFLSVAGDVKPTFKEQIRFAIRLYNSASPSKTVERGAPFWWLDLQCSVPPSASNFCCNLS
jgi:hypothetical protein